MFAGITSLLWGSSAPALTPASGEPAVAVIDDDLCKMEVGSDTGCSDEEMVHLPKPTSDGEEDWVVVTEGRAGKKEAPKKKKQGAASMDFDGKVEENEVLKSGDQFMTAEPEKSENKSTKVLRVESKIGNGETKAWSGEPKRVSPKSALASSLPKEAVAVDAKIKRLERKSSVKDARKDSSDEVKPKLATVERKMEKMNLSRMRGEQKREKIESKLRHIDAKRMKSEPKIFQAKTDFERTETEMVQEVDVTHEPKRVTVHAKLVTEELELVKAQPAIVPAIIKEQIAKEKSEPDDTGFQLVHSRYNRYNFFRAATTRKEAIEFYPRQCEEENLEVARAVPDEMRIEPKTISDEITVKVESEAVKVDVMDDETEIATDGAETKVYMAENNGIVMEPKSVSTEIKSKPLRRRRTRVRSTLDDPVNRENYLDHMRCQDMDIYLSAFASMPKKTRYQASCEDNLEFDVSPVLGNHSKPKRIDEEIRELLECGRCDGQLPESSHMLSKHFRNYRDLLLSTRIKIHQCRMVMGNPLATPSEVIDEEIELLYAMLNDKGRKNSEVGGLVRMLNEKLKERREKLQKELNLNKENEARAAEIELKKEEHRQETRLAQKAVHPVQHKRLSRKNLLKSNAARLMSSAGNGRLRRSDRLQPRQASGANNNRKCC